MIASRSNATSLPRWRVWLIAVRPRTLTTSTTPIMVATLLAWQQQVVSPGLTLLMLIASVMTHAGCNFTIDYFDSIRGVDSVQTHGPGDMLRAGLITSDDLRRAITISFTLALLAALPVMISIGWIVLVIASSLLALPFSTPQGHTRLPTTAWARPGVFLAMGVAMVCGTYYVHAGTVTGTAFALSCSIGLYAAAILHANNTRDAEVDRPRGKITLANMLGRTAAVREYALLVLMPLLVALLVLPLALRVTRLLEHCQTVAECNSAIPQSAQLHMKYAVLVGFGLVIMRISGQ